jgi:hypothetical protein
VCFHEQFVNIRERLDATFDCALKPLKGVRVREMHRRLDGRQDVLGSMFGLSREDGDVRLTSLPLADVAGNFGCANDLAAKISYRRNRKRDVN